MGGLAITVDRDLAGAGTAVMLGSGLGRVCEEWPVVAECSFSDIPGLDSSPIAGHRGVIRKCDLRGAACLFVLGRKHCYEGSDRPVQSLIDFLARIGIRRLLLTSASGSLTRSIQPGEIGIAHDSLNLQFCPPRGGTPRHSPQAPAPEPGSPLLRERPGLAEPCRFDPALTALVKRAAGRAGVPLRSGCMASMMGPTYETVSEVAMLRKAGAHFVTMSAAPELQFAAARGMATAALAIITNYATGISGDPLTHEEVLKRGARATDSVRAIVGHLIDLQ